MKTPPAERIRQLRALAASTTFEGERDAALRKAAELEAKLPASAPAAERSVDVDLSSWVIVEVTPQGFRVRNATPEEARRAEAGEEAAPVVRGGGRIRRDRSSAVGSRSDFSWGNVGSAGRHWRVG